MATTTTYGTASPTHNVLLYFLAIFIPPAAVFFKRGIMADFWINILLWILGWIPAVLHAWWIISRSEGAMGPATANTTGMGTTGHGVGSTGAGYGTGLREKPLGTTAPTSGTAGTAPAAGVGTRTV